MIKKQSTIILTQAISKPLSPNRIPVSKPLISLIFFAHRSIFALSPKKREFSTSLKKLDVSQLTMSEHVVTKQEALNQVKNISNGGNESVGIKKEAFNQVKNISQEKTLHTNPDSNTYLQDSKLLRSGENLMNQTPPKTDSNPSLQDSKLVRSGENPINQTPPNTDSNPALEGSELAGWGENLINQTPSNPDCGSFFQDSVTVRWGEYFINLVNFHPERLTHKVQITHEQLAPYYSFSKNSFISIGEKTANTYNGFACTIPWKHYYSNQKDNLQVMKEFFDYFHELCLAYYNLCLLFWAISLLLYLALLICTTYPMWWKYSTNLYKNIMQLCQTLINNLREMVDIYSDIKNNINLLKKFKRVYNKFILEKKDSIISKTDILKIFLNNLTDIIEIYLDFFNKFKKHRIFSSTDIQGKSQINTGILQDKLIFNKENSSNAFIDNLHRSDLLNTDITVNMFSNNRSTQPSPTILGLVIIRSAVFNRGIHTFTIMSSVGVYTCTRNTRGEPTPILRGTQLWVDFRSIALRLIGHLVIARDNYLSTNLNGRPMTPSLRDIGARTFVISSRVRTPNEFHGLIQVMYTMAPFMFTRTSPRATLVNRLIQSLELFFSLNTIPSPIQHPITIVATQFHRSDSLHIFMIVSYRGLREGIDLPRTYTLTRRITPERLPLLIGSEEWEDFRLTGARIITDLNIQVQNFISTNPDVPIGELNLATLGVPNLNILRLLPSPNELHGMLTLMFILYPSIFGANPSATSVTVLIQNLQLTFNL